MRATADHAVMKSANYVVAKSPNQLSQIAQIQ